jgi:hypothetical protein
VHPRVTSLAVVLLLTLLGPARAADERLAGSKLVLRKSSVAERLVLVAREGVTAPLPGSTEDPALVGGDVEISNPKSGEHAGFATSAQDWTVNALGTVFRFQNHLETGPGSEVRTIVIKHKRQLKISTRAFGITLDEQAQRALSVVVRTGTRRYCLLFGGRIGKDKPGRFVAHKAPAPTACPGPIVVATTTTTSRPPGTRPTSTSVTSSTHVTNTSATSSTSTSSSTSTTHAPGSSTTTTVRPTTTTVRPTTTTLRPTTTTVRATTTSSTQPPATTSSTTQPPPTTSSSTSSTSSTSVVTTSTTTTTQKPCSFRGNSCKGACPAGLRCATIANLCACVL